MINNVACFKSYKCVSSSLCYSSESAPWYLKKSHKKKKKDEEEEVSEAESEGDKEDKELTLK